MAKQIKGMNPLLTYISDLLSLFSSKPIVAPRVYRDQVLAVKDTLKEDVSGLVNTVLDFAVNCACVSYKADCGNENLEEVINDWLDNINEDYRGRIPTGIEALAKEYFRERWKGSSNLLLRTIWTKRNGLTLPTTMYFVDGEDIKYKTPNETAVVLAEEEYYLRVSSDEKDDIHLPQQDNEMIYVQRPFEAWGVLEPTPWLIKKGIWHNLKSLQLISEKGEFIVSRALEYLFVIKKGSEKLTSESITYSRDELKTISEDFKELMDRKKTENGLPTYTTNFDTELEQFIPDYKKVLDEALYAPHEKKLLAGLGLVDIIEGAASTRRESILNPKPFISEVKQGVKDFKAILKDIVKEIVKRNSSTRPKWMKTSIDIATSPISDFITTDVKTLIRSLYDRGLLSKRTTTEVLVEVDYDIEVQRRETETSLGHDESMYPPIIQNQEESDTSGEPSGDLDVNGKPISPDKKGLEKKNYTNAEEIVPKRASRRNNGKKLESALKLKELELATNKNNFLMKLIGDK